MPATAPAPVLVPGDRSLTAHRSGPLAGRVRVPGDKSISHRALMLGTLAIGETVVEGLLASEDVHATAAAMRAFGATIEAGDALWRVHGLGARGLLEPEDVVDFGNAGTGVRLAMGMAAAHPFATTFTGDASLASRPMGRVIEPLERMGAQVVARTGNRLPLSVRGLDPMAPITYRLPVPSAQVKSAVLLAGLSIDGITTVVETVPTRDHTERMLRAFGAEIEETRREDGTHVSVRGMAELKPTRISVPSDPSSAAFPLVAALVCEGSDVTLENVLLNPARTGLIETLVEMGGAVEVDEREAGGERVGEVRVRASELTGVTVPPERAPSMIDEFPVLAVAAANATGETLMQGLAELRVKESDRLAATAEMLTRNGVDVETGEDWMRVRGRGPGNVPGGGEVAARLDHRIAMSAVVLGLAAKAPVSVDDASPIATSFPGFTELMAGLGAKLEAA